MSDSRPENSAALNQYINAIMPEIEGLIAAIPASIETTVQQSLLLEMSDQLDGLRTVIEELGYFELAETSGLMSLYAQVLALNTESMNAAAAQTLTSALQAIATAAGGEASVLVSANAELQQALSELPDGALLQANEALFQDVAVDVESIDPFENDMELTLDAFPIEDDHSDDHFPVITEDDDLLSMFAPDDSTDSDFGQLVTSLFDERSIELNAVAAELMQSSEDDRPALQSLFSEQLAELSVLLMSMNLNGSLVIVNFVETNVLALTDAHLQGDRSNLHAALETWLPLLAVIFSNPEDDSAFIDLLNLLEEPCWPQPLGYSQTRLFIEAIHSDLEAVELIGTDVREVNVSLNDLSLTFDADANPSLVEAFFIEAPVQANELAQIQEQLAELGADAELIRASQRLTHTIKGTAQLVGVQGLSNVAHHMEDLFDFLLLHPEAWSEALADVLIDASDALGSLVEAMISDGTFDEAHTLAAYRQLVEVAAAMDQGQLADFFTTAEAHQRVESAATEVTNVADVAPQSKSEPALAAETEVKDDGAEFVRVPKALLDQLLDLSGEMAISLGQMQERMNRLNEHRYQLRDQDAELHRRRLTLEKVVSLRNLRLQQRLRQQGNAYKQEMDSLELDQYDEIYTAAHGFIEITADSGERLSAIADDLENLDELLVLQNRLQRNVQSIVSDTRLISVDTLAPRLKRVVRQAAKVTGKKVHFELLGGEHQIDGDVLNQLADPLMHMLRNAIDHSLENDPNQPNTLTLSFRQSGNSMAIQCRDNGRGFDTALIEAKAKRLGLIAEDHSLDDHDLIQLVMHSGFSTREETTQLSGRGVGMDAVSQRIRQLKGNVLLSNAVAEDGHTTGSLVQLTVPLNILSHHCIQVVAQQQTYSVPSASVQQIILAAEGNLEFDQGNLVFHWEDQSYPVQPLANLLGVYNGYLDATSASVLLVDANGLKHAVIVDQVLSSSEQIVKPLGSLIPNIDGVVGVSIQGNGDVISVLDPIALIGRSNVTGHIELQTALPAEAVSKVLVVDDSLSVRNSLCQLVNDYGMKAIPARDGVEALNLAIAEQPNLILTDLEMPRMTGLELARHIRNNQRTATTPLFMVTSRTMDKHRELAQESGVDRYFTKPFSEDELILAISTAVSA